jgi:hypothetical protein
MQSTPFPHHHLFNPHSSLTLLPIRLRYHHKLLAVAMFSGLSSQHIAAFRP